MPPPPTGKQKNKIAEPSPTEDTTYTPSGDHERLLQIFVSGRFTPQQSQTGKFDEVVDTVLKGGAANNNTTTIATGPASTELGGKRVGTPTPVASKRSGTPGKKEHGGLGENPLGKGCCSLAGGTYTNFNFSPELYKPFFSLYVPGLELIGASDVVVAGLGEAQGVPSSSPNGSRQSTSRPRDTSPLSQRFPLNTDERLLRCIPKGEHVNPDGGFKIELLKKKIRIEPSVVDSLLSKRFKFGVHSVPELGAMTAKYGSLVTNVPDLNTTPSKKSGQAKVSQASASAQSGASNKNNKNKIVADPVDLSQDPSTVSWVDCTTVLEHSFDLGNVLVDSCVDRIDLVCSDSYSEFLAQTATDVRTSGEDDSETQQTALRLSSSGASSHPPSSFLLDIHTAATRAVLAKSHARKTTLFVRDVPGFSGLTISVVCSAPLLCEENLKRYLPMIVDISHVTNLPPLGKSSVDLRHTMVPRQDEIMFASTQHRATTTLGGYNAESYASMGGPKFQPVRVTFNGIRDYEQPNTTASHRHSRDIEFNERFIFFLHKYSVLELYEHFFFRGIEFCVHDRELVSSSEGTLNEEPQSESYGVADLSLRAALKGDTIFNVNAQLVPRREVGGSSAAIHYADYLSNATTLNAKIRLLARIPRATYTSPRYLATPFPSEGLFKNRTHLSRVVFVLPYSSPSTRRILQGLMGTLLQFTRAPEGAGAIVEQRPEPPALRPPTPVVEDLGASARKGTGKVKSGSAGSGGVGGKGFKKVSSEEKECPTVEEEMRAFADSLPPVSEDAIFVVPEGVSGFELMDGENRIVCVEGYPFVLYRLVEVVTHILGPQADADPTIRILFNTDLPFPQRWYHTWPSLVKPTPRLEDRMLAANNGSSRGTGFAVVSPTRNEFGSRVQSADSASPQPPVSRVGESSEQSPKARSDGKKGNGKTSKLAASQKQAAAEALAAEQLRLEQEREAEEAAEAEAARKAALKGDRDDLDSGGVGGRIRRIRLARSITELRGQQRNFLRRFFSIETLQCISKLNSLRQTRSIAEAVDHCYFPTASELIALERVQGATLEVFDICGSDTYFTFEKEMAKEAMSEADIEQAKELEGAVPRRPVRDIAASELLSRGLDLSQAGKMLTFIGTPAHPSQLSRLPKLTPDYFPRHPQKNYMVIDGAKTPSGAPLLMLCCYPTRPPSQLLRYYCNAQIIGALERADSTEQVAVLFVLHYETVARNGSDDRNPAYEEHLRRERRRADPREYTRIMSRKRAYYLATHSAFERSSALSHGDSDLEDTEGFVDSPPEIPEGDSAKEDLIDSVLVRNDYVTLNKDTSETLRRWGKPTSTDPQSRQEVTAAKNAMLQKLFDDRERKRNVAEVKTETLSQRASHGKPFVSGAAKTVAESRAHPRAVSSDDVDRTPYVDPPLAKTDPIGSGKGQGSNLPPMSFKGARTVLEETDVNELLPDVFKSKLATSAPAMTKAEETAADAERIRKLKEEWMGRLVVDDPHFSVTTRLPRDKPLSSIDQFRSILEDPPRKASIKKNYAPPAPPSIRTAERAVTMGRVESYISKHPENRTFHVTKTGVENTFVKDFPIVTETEKSSSPLYRH